MAAKAKQAEVEAEEAAEEAAPARAAGRLAKLKKKPPLKLVIAAAAALLVVGGAGVGGYLYFGKGGSEHHAEAPPKPATFVDLPDVLVNLSSAGSERTQYLKVKITLELPDENLVQKIQPLMPRVMDAFQTYLRELRPTDLDGSAGLYRLKEELTRRVNAAVSPNHINAVLFKEIVVQ
jgi:flagellar FliL protein